MASALNFRGLVEREVAEVYRQTALELIACTTNDSMTLSELRHVCGRVRDLAAAACSKVMDEWDSP